MESSHLTIVSEAPASWIPLLQGFIVGLMALFGIWIASRLRMHEARDKRVLKSYASLMARLWRTDQAFRQFADRTTDELFQAGPMAHQSARIRILATNFFAFANSEATAYLTDLYQVRLLESNPRLLSELDKLENRYNRHWSETDNADAQLRGINEMRAGLGKSLKDFTEVVNQVHGRRKSFDLEPHERS